MRVLELLIAHLCHELSAPIAAINNGVELLTGEGDSELSPGTNFTRDATMLIGQSARRAACRLQFYRFAYGFGSGSTIAGPAPHELAALIFDASPIVCDYPQEVQRLPLEWQKLGCNLLAVGALTLPRGGHLGLTAEPLALEATHSAANLSREVRAALMLAMPADELTSRTVQPFLAGLLAKALGFRLAARTEQGRIRLVAVAGGA
jgi:histidine phosphotransferase ChpT